MFKSLFNKSLRLKFIGDTNSRGLTNGKIYKVKIYTGGSFIWVKWGHGFASPYASIEALAADWEFVRE